MRIVLTFILFFLNQFCFSQYIDTKVISANDGLFSNNIQKTFIDSEGSLWIGSRAGLSKKKMKSFEIVQQAKTYKFNNIFDIYEDKDKNMWIAGYGQGVLFFDKSKSKLINTKVNLVNDFVRKIFEFNDKIYVGTTNGISIISKNNFSIINPDFKQNANYDFAVSSFFVIENRIYATVVNDGIYLIEDDKLFKVSGITKIFSSFVFKNKIFLGTESQLIVLDSNSFDVLTKYPVSSIWEFYVYKDQLYFVASGLFDSHGGFYRLENDKLVNRIDALKIPFLDLKSFSYDKENEMLYIGTQNNGLVQINLNSPIFHQNKFEEVYSLSINANKHYVFHSEGFSIIDNNKILKNLNLSKFKEFQLKNTNKFHSNLNIENHFYPLEFSIPKEKIKFYYSEIYKNSIWVSSNIGIFKLNFEGDIINYYPIHIFYFSFFENKLISAVPYGGVRIFSDMDKMEYEYFHDWKNDNIPSDIISITKNKNAIYFASALSGLYEYKNGKFKSFIESNEFIENKLKRITISENETLFAVTDFNDVFEIDLKTNPNKIIKHISYEKIKGSTTLFVCEINGVLFIGTNLGINVFYNEKYFFIDKSQGLTNYNLKNAYVYNDDLYVLTSKGYFVLNKSYFKKEKTCQTIAVVDYVLLNNDTISLEKFKDDKNEINFKYNENNLNIFFSIKNEKYPDKLIFKYRLKQDEPWIELAFDNQINLSYLDKGSYIVELLISNQDTGNINVQRLLEFNINPPFYLKLPFLFFSFFVFFVIIYYIIKMRFNFLRNNQEKEKALIALKSDKEKKELLFDKQLAEVKLQALKSQMNSHFLFNVLSSIQFYIISHDVDNALYYLERFSKLIRTTLDFSDKKSVNLNEELNYLKQYIEIENIRLENPIIFTQIVDSTLNLNSIDIEPLLLQPFIENSIIHAFPNTILKPEITIKIEPINNHIKILIIDNGIGFQDKRDKEYESKGILIVKKRLSLKNKYTENKMKINSSKNGTIIEIII